MHIFSLGHEILTSMMMNLVKSLPLLWTMAKNDSLNEDRILKNPSPFIVGTYVYHLASGMPPTALEGVRSVCPSKAFKLKRRTSQRSMLIVW